MLAWIAVVASVSILLGATAAWYAVNTYDGNIRRIEAFLPGRDRPADADGHAQNILLVGVDDRSDATDAELRQLRTTRNDGAALTDTMILLHIPPRRDHAVLVSFPRDSWVQIPGHGYGKLNSAYVLGGGGERGAQLLTQSLESLTGVRIDHYVQVDLLGFLRITNAIGGVEVCLKHPAKDHFSGVDLPAGRQTISGSDALAFVRQRHGLPRGDLDRIARQQAFLGAVVRKVTSAGVLLNPFKLTALLDATTSALTVDAGLGPQGLRSLAFQMRQVAAGDVEFRTIPVSDIAAYREGQNVVLLDRAELPGFFRSLSDEPVAASPATPSPTVAVPPSEIRVRVLNGTGRHGLGRSAAAALTDAGFQVPDAATNAPSGDNPTTVVRYGPDKADSARTLAAAVPGAVLEEDNTLGRTLVLVIGDNFAGVGPAPGAPTRQSPSEAAPPAAAASAPPTLAPPAHTAADADCVN
ncbi:MAG TPA: LCP family protein [Mycobacteriales bacterium]|nr:LCP family protein [Mycobacteriales bacterium]